MHHLFCTSRGAWERGKRSRHRGDSLAFKEFYNATGEPRMGRIFSFLTHFWKMKRERNNEQIRQKRNDTCVPWVLSSNKDILDDLLCWWFVLRILKEGQKQREKYTCWFHGHHHETKCQHLWRGINRKSTDVNF